MTEIGYMRVSTHRQDLGMQRDALIRSGVLAGDIYSDVMSGSTTDRDGLAGCLGRLVAGDVLVVWKLDRVGRSLVHLAGVVKELEGRGVGFRSLTEAIDTTTAGGRMVFHIIAALAEFERELIRERVTAGVRRRIGENGGVWGRRCAVEYDAGVIMEMIGRGLSYREVAEEVGVSASTVARVAGRHA